MKTKKLKRVLSAFLAVLMVLSVMPMSVFAATDDDLANLKSTIAAYETKMDGTVYTNMRAAYDAYIHAKECADSYEYGRDTGLDLAGAAATLNNAVANLGTFTPAKANVTGSFIYDDSFTNYQDYYKNLLYSPQTTTQAVGESQKVVTASGEIFWVTQECWQKFFIFHPVTVMLYDGINEPVMPVMVESEPGQTQTYSKDAVLYTAFTNSNDLKLTENWHGTDGRVNFMYCYNQGVTNVGYRENDTNANSGKHTDSLFFANLLHFQGSFSDNQYYKTVTLDMNFKCSTSADSSTNGIKTGNLTSSAPIYVINYKALIDALGTNASVLQNIENYDNDWANVQKYMSALDAATSFNPSNYDYSNTATTVASCASGIESAINTMNSTRTALTASDDSYDQLRSALAQARSAYEIGNSEGIYTTETWEDFAAAYESARNAMNQVDNSGYKANGSEVISLAETLNTAFSNLATVARLADATEMNAAVAKANTINNYLDYLTAETKEPFVAAFDNAKTAFQSGDTTLPVIFTEDQQAELDALTDALNEAIDAIVLDTTRLTAGLQEAHAIDQSTVLDAAALNRAIADADTVLTNALATDLTADNIANIVSGYIDACEKIEEAIVYAETPYTRQQDKVTDSSSNSTSVVWGDTHNNTTFTYPTGVVIVKTSSDQTEFNIGKYQLYSNNYRYSNPTSYSQLIYELGITNAAVGSSTGSMTSGQFRLAGFDGEVIAKTGDETVQGGLYYLNSAPASVSAGLSDGSTDTYLWMKEGEFTRTSDVIFTAPSLATSKAPTTTTYSVAKSYLYAQCKYFNWSAQTETYNGVTDTPMDVTVVDISPLCYLLDSVDQYTNLNQQNGYKWYTADSYNDLLNAVSAAKVLTNNNSIHTYDSAKEYGTAVAQAWNTLRNAISNLTPATYVVTFNYKNAAGADTKTQKGGNYGTELVAPTDLPSYTDGDYRYVFDGWDKEVSSTITGDETYTAVYRQELNTADFSEIDEAVEEVTTLADNVYSVEDLEELNEHIESLKYYNYTEDEREETLANEQSLINAEAAAVHAWTLDESELDLSTAEAALEQAKFACDSDAVDTNAIQTFELSQAVEVNGEMVTGLLYSTQKELDTAISALISSLQPKTYTVQLNGVVLGEYAYGTRLVVNGDGQASENENIETNDGAKNYAWYYSFNSVQVTDTTSPKYMTTAPSFGFVVKGNTFLTTEEADSSEGSYVVTFVNGINGHVYDVVYTTGTVDIPAAPDCAFYKFTGYDNGSSEGGQITVSQDTVITANYDINNIESYNISFVDGSTYGQIASGNYEYNDKVTCTKAGTYVWAEYLGEQERDVFNEMTGWKTQTVSCYRIVAYGDTINFRACADVEYDAFTKSDWQIVVGDTTLNYIDDDDANGASSVTKSGIVKADTKFSMIGQFALPEGATAVEYGMLFTTESGKTLTLENASADSTIKRLKASKHTGESDTYGQYVISIKSATLSGSYDFTYRSYLTYTMNGKTYTVYADKPVTENVQF